MAALLTALIAFNIALYKRVSELSVMTPSELKKLKDSFNSEISKSANQILEEMNSNMKFLFSLPFGIQNNVTISSFVGFRYAYNKPYSHITTGTEMDEIKNSCSLTTILCLGGVDNKNQVLRVVSCGFCSVVLSK
jgi:hypothetical protein